LILDTLQRLRPQKGWKQILDIGCGDGLFFPHLRNFGEVEGVEPMSDLVSPTNPDRNRIAICPFDNNFQPGKQYSLILMLDVLEHLEHPVEAVRHVMDLLEPDGTFVLTVPAFMALWTNHDVVNHHFTRYTKSQFHDVSRAAGLTIIEERYIYHWTCVPKLAAGLIERIFRLQPKPAHVPPSWVNDPLHWFSRVEQKTISRLPMPFGSSLLVIAKGRGHSPRDGVAQA
jgi:SAM-dependent methyltransferase